MQVRTVHSKSPAEVMSGFYIYCFDCKKTLQRKSEAKGHRGHEVDYIRRSDGARHMFITDGSVPLASHYDGLSSDGFRIK